MEISVFDSLSEKEKKHIVDMYALNKELKENGQPIMLMSDIQESLAEDFGVSPRSIRSWAKKLGVSTHNSSLNFNKLSKSKGTKNVLVIGDPHIPFGLDGYLEFCKRQHDRYNCNEVICIGDIIDNHYTSYHETDSDGMGGADELNLSRKLIKQWYKVFPKLTVILGNHDRMIMRKAQTSAIPSAWIKSYKEVLEVPNWNFVDRLVVDGVQYIHGEGGTARTKCRADMMNTVQGHLHTQAYTEWYVGANFKIFGSQVGCGIDADSYAMAYAKRGRKPAIGCMVILQGETPINILMNL